VDPKLASLASVLLRGRILDIVRIIAQHPTISQGEIIDELPISRRVFRLYANLLVSNGLIQETRDVKRRRYTALPPLQDALRLAEAGRGANEPAPPTGPTPTSEENDAEA
jgi:hypothetical protein